MKKIRQWMALALSVIVLTEPVAAHGSQVSDTDAVTVAEQESVAPEVEEEIETTEELVTEQADLQQESDEFSGVSMEDIPVLETENPEEGTSEEAAEEVVSTESPLLNEQEKSLEDIQAQEEIPATGDTEVTGGNEPQIEYYLDITDYSSNLLPGEQFRLEIATNIPQNQLIYTSMNPAIATVDQTGLVTAVSAGATGYEGVTIEVRWVNPDNEWDYVRDSCWVRVENTISVSQMEESIYAKQAPFQLTAQTNPAGAVTWTSSDTSKATVDSSGRVSPKKSGWVTITATANGVSDTCSFYINEAVLNLDYAATVYKKNPMKLMPEVMPAAKVTWKSSNKKVATVNSKGVVTGKKAGTATITAKANGITRKCKVTVVEPTLTLSSGYGYSFLETMGIFQGSTAQLNVSAPSYVNIKWKSSNKKIAKVDKEGNIKGIKPGTVTITATIPGAKASYTVKVVKNSYTLNFDKRTVMKGDTATLYVKSGSENIYPSFRVEEDANTVTLSTDGNSCSIKGNEKGKAVVEAYFWVYTDGYGSRWSQKCTVNVVDSGISRQQFSVAKGGNQQLKIIEPEEGKTISSVVWSSTAPGVASVDATGLVTAKKPGSSTIKASVTYTDGTSAAYTSSMKVSNPSLKSTTIVAAMGGRKSVGLKGINAYTEIQWKSSKKKVLTVSPDGSVIPKKKGSATITAIVDGKKLTCKVHISNPTLNETYAAIAKGGNAKIQIKGLVAKSTVTYKASNPDVAAVSSTGEIKAKTGGRCEITVNADGKEFCYLVEVASQTAINACKEGYAIIQRSTYSQARRMTEGYYDCSALVFRGYNKNTVLLGGTTAWAPTAAGMAQYMASTGKVLSWSPIPVEQLRPGDLIFYGHQDNGRYLGIYHVSMYYGNGLRLEKPLDSYWERGNIVMIARPAP